jgi:hypothetical protein
MWLMTFVYFMFTIVNTLLFLFFHECTFVNIHIRHKCKSYSLVLSLIFAFPTYYSFINKLSQH